MKEKITLCFFRTFAKLNRQDTIEHEQTNTTNSCVEQCKSEFANQQDERKDPDSGNQTLLEYVNLELSQPNYEIINFNKQKSVEHHN